MVSASAQRAQPSRALSLEDAVFFVCMRALSCTKKKLHLPAIMLGVIGIFAGDFFDIQAISLCPREAHCDSTSDGGLKHPKARLWSRTVNTLVNTYKLWFGCSGNCFGNCFWKCGVWPRLKKYCAPHLGPWLKNLFGGAGAEVSVHLDSCEVNFLIWVRG